MLLLDLCKSNIGGNFTTSVLCVTYLVIVELLVSQSATRLEVLDVTPILVMSSSVIVLLVPKPFIRSLTPSPSYQNRL